MYQRCEIRSQSTEAQKLHLDFFCLHTRLCEQRPTTYKLLNYIFARKSAGATNTADREHTTPPPISPATGTGSTHTLRSPRLHLPVPVAPTVRPGNVSCGLHEVVCCEGGFFHPVFFAVHRAICHETFAENDFPHTGDNIAKAMMLL